MGLFVNTFLGIRTEYYLSFPPSARNEAQRQYDVNVEDCLEHNVAELIRLLYVVIFHVHHREPHQNAVKHYAEQGINEVHLAVRSGSPDSHPENEIRYNQWHHHVLYGFWLEHLRG